MASAARRGLTTAGSVAASRRTIPDGVWPTMITPFLSNKEKSIDWKGLDMLTEWYIRSGVAGIFSVCLSSEMFQLTNKERIEIAQRVVDKAAGRVPVVAGATFEGNLDEQAQLMRDMGQIASAVIIITNQIAAMDDSDEVWLSNAQKLLDLTGDIPVGIYETPIPKVRSLTPAMLKWAASNDRFVFHKDTSLDTATMINKLKAVQSVESTKLKFFTAKTQFVKTLLDNGGNGFSGVIANFFPWMMVWMTGKGREVGEKEREKMHRFLSVSDRVLAHKYPTSAKVYLNKFYNAPLAPVSRIFDVTLNEQDLMSLESMKEYMEETAKELGVAIVDPTSQ
ncbi:PREDICTED: uncharacterized protein LOC105313135 isoform X1 [Amphimedon queenslandica]|uniref:Dihydrodipicolinate synthase family protein n=1 Tax=Amphimedon queenslandica TaxID=400682 RepID=A0A1X7UM20_AMPQE|nr:PREDICTED: uncharacterized protein LOC105313135 isoform X1 [Amphimedon queenslandica]|eukprot:XP_011404617.2 PREDICTED: uncharacterized protein LOC105313135 isoform X1 [Amphimedon queenslandica]